MTETEAQKIRELENYLIKMPFHRDRRMNDFAYEIWVGPDDAFLLDEPDLEFLLKKEQNYMAFMERLKDLLWKTIRQLFMVYAALVQAMFRQRRLEIN